MAWINRHQSHLSSGNAARTALPRLITAAVAVAVTIAGVMTAAAATDSGSGAAAPHPPSGTTAVAAGPSADARQPQARGGLFDRWAELATERRTRHFLDMFERRDVDAVSAMLHPDVTLVHPLALSGDRADAARFTGRAEVLGYFADVFGNMRHIRFTDQRVTVAAGGGEAFVQADGDLTLGDGRPYQNVYVFRFEWRDGRIIAADEYANPLTFCQTIGSPLCP